MQLNFIIFYSIFFILSTSLCSIELTQKEREFIENHPKITLASGISFEPFIVLNRDGTITGYDRDILNLISNRIGLEINLRVGVWSDMQRRAKNGEFDGLSSAGYYRERESYFNRSISYIELTPFIFSRVNEKITSPKDLENKIVALQKSNYLFYSLFKRLTKDIKNIEIIYFDRVDEVVQAVVSKRADFTIFDETLFYIAKRLGVSSAIDISFSIAEPFEVMFWFRKDYPELISIVNRAIKSISERERSQLRDRWLMNTNLLQESKLNLSNQERIYLFNKRRLKLCITPNWMPYEGFNANKEHIGVSAEFFEEFQRAIVTPIDVVQTDSWSESLNYIKERKCDIISLASQTTEREKFLNFTVPYIETSTAIATDIKAQYITNFSKVLDREFAVVKDYALINRLKEIYKGIKIREVKNIEQAFEMIEDGEIFGVIDSSLVLNYEIQKLNFKDIKISGEIESVNTKLAVATRNDEPELVKIFNKAIASIDRSDRDRILNRWSSIKIDREFDYTLFYKVGVPIFFILFLVYIWILHLKRLNEQLKVAKIRAEEANLSKSLFLANVSHELRTPLNAIIGFSQLLKRNRALKREQIDNLNSILKSGEYLLALINDILDISKVESGKVQIHLERFNLYELIETISKSIKLKSDEKMLYFEIFKAKNLIEYIQTDFNKLRQILLNLLINAVKYTDRGGVKFKISSKELGSDRAILKFEVVDSGVGVLSSDRDRIFENFIQIGEREGSGLGLAISKKFANLLGGDIEIESELGVGSKFILKLPVDIVTKAQLSKNESELNIEKVLGDRVYKVLIVDDIADNRDFLNSILKDIGFHTYIAKDGFEAIEIFKSIDDIDLVLADIKMPKLDGVGLTSKIRLTKKAKETIVILMSASVLNSKELVDIRADDFIYKPFKEFELFNKIRKHLKLEFRYSKVDILENEIEIEEIKFPKDISIDLERACKIGDVDLIENLIKDNLKVNSKVKGKFLELARNFEYEKIVNLLQRGRGE